MVTSHLRCNPFSRCSCNCISRTRRYWVHSLSGRSGLAIRLAFAALHGFISHLPQHFTALRIAINTSARSAPIGISVHSRLVCNTLHRVFANGTMSARSTVYSLMSSSAILSGRQLCRALGDALCKTLHGIGSNPLALISGD